ncbi:lambda-exonuclease family protein [Campylobacter coli]|uniref:lambda-exonuclease family protein n=1 Tax=Campylobacter coli TaxID=195 RepID=UPI00292CA452|nr:YqaJ viral recombinase family protein [Campylobacter coli]HEB7643350.1 YqaJ viral recombinase family protein [Campylobacter coli]HEF9156740.1 YqaJ viral recombinase family protein [Campylobacter coli]HEF9170929.1 YqaJ viral recombinase family protein [Campylobacter coli]
MNCKIIDLEQGSVEWLNFRKGKITASIVASCIGEKGAFLSKEKAKELIQGVYEPYVSEAMKKGREYEELIRAKMEFIIGKDITPIVIQSLENELFMASLDGIDNEKTIYEFKYSTNNKEYEQVLKFKKPSSKYYAQIQFQLFVGGFEKCVFAVLNENDDLTYCMVKSDKEYQDFMLRKIDEFIKDYLVNQKSDYKELEDTKAKNLTIEIIRLENTIKPIKEKLESLKKELIALANGEKARCLDITIYPQSRTTIDYKGFLEQKNITVPKEFYKESISMCLKIKKGA